MFCWTSNPLHARAAEHPAPGPLRRRSCASTGGETTRDVFLIRPAMPALLSTPSPCTDRACARGPESEGGPCAGAPPSSAVLLSVRLRPPAQAPAGGVEALPPRQVEAIPLHASAAEHPAPAPGAEEPAPPPAEQRAPAESAPPRRVLCDSGVEAPEAGPPGVRGPRRPRPPRTCGGPRGRTGPAPRD